MPEHRIGFRGRTWRGRAWTLLALLALLALVAPALPAQEAPTPTDEELAAIENLADRFEILPLSDGYLLRPLAEEGAATPDVDFDVLEIRVGGVAVDGVPVSAEEFRQRFGKEAELLAPWLYREIVREDPSPEADRPPDVSPEPPAEDPSPAIRRSRDRTVLFEDLTVDADESVRDVVVIFGTLELDGEVRGDAVVIGDRAEVRGRVKGDLTVVGGSIELLAGAEIYGDVIAVGSRIEADDEAEIFGEITDVAMGRVVFDDEWPRFDRPVGGWGPFSFGDVIAKIFFTIVLALFVLLIFWLARDYIGSVAERVQLEPWKAGLVGLITQLVFVPALIFIVVVLAISIIGIPVAVLVFLLGPVLLGFAMLFGYSGVALLAGRFLEKRFNLVVGPFIVVVLGLLLIQSMSILGEALMFLPGPIKISAVLLLLLGGLVKYLSWTVGLGGVLLRHLSPLPAEPSWAPPTPALAEDWEDRDD